MRPKGRGNTCPPILSYMAKWTLEEISSYCKKKGWKLEDLSAQLGKKAEDMRTKMKGMRHHGRQKEVQH